MWIAFAIVVPLAALSVMFLHRQARAWSVRRLSGFEVILGGLTAWFVLLVHLAWMVLLFITLVEFFDSDEGELLWILFFNALVAGSSANFLIRSRTALGIDDTFAFFQKSLVFRKTDFHTADVRALAEREERDRRQRELRQEQLRHQERTDPKAWERMRLENDLQLRKRQELRVKQALSGVTVDIMDEWKSRTSGNQKHLLYDAVSAVAVDGVEHRLMFVVDLPAFHQNSFQNDAFLPGLYKEVYDFLQTLMTERWLKAYLQPCPAFALTCRALTTAANGSEFFYPFLKVQVTPARLDELSVSFFEGESLSQAVTVTYQNGLPV